MQNSRKCVFLQPPRQLSALLPNDRRSLWEPTEEQSGVGPGWQYVKPALGIEKVRLQGPYQHVHRTEAAHVTKSPQWHGLQA